MQSTDISPGGNGPKSGIEIDTSNSRIWLLRYPEEFRLAEFHQLLEDLQLLNPERRKHAVLIDLSRLRPMSADALIRGEIAEALEAKLEHFGATIVAEARVTLNPLIRGMTTVLSIGHRAQAVLCQRPRLARAFDCCECLR